MLKDAHRQTMTKSMRRTGASATSSLMSGNGSPALKAGMIHRMINAWADSCDNRWGVAAFVIWVFGIAAVTAGCVIR